MNIKKFLYEKSHCDALLLSIEMRIMNTIKNTQDTCHIFFKNSVFICDYESFSY